MLNLILAATLAAAATETEIAPAIEGDGEASPEVALEAAPEPAAVSATGGAEAASLAAALEAETEPLPLNDERQPDALKPVEAAVATPESATDGATGGAEAASPVVALEAELEPLPLNDERQPDALKPVEAAVATPEPAPTVAAEVPRTSEPATEAEGETDAAVDVDGIVATVGTEQILRSEVLAEMHRPGGVELSFETARNALIDRRLIIKAAADAKMTMQEWMVENRCREIIDNVFDGDRNKLKALLAQQKTKYSEWRQRIKDGLIADAMRWTIVDKNVSVSPSDIKREYESHPERYREEAKTSVAVIMLKPSEAEKRDEITAILATNDFDSVARQYSADSHAAEGGLWKDIRPEDVFRPEICETLKGVKVGESTGWIDLDGWSFILKKVAESGERESAIAECYEAIEENVRRQKAKKLYEEWMKILRSEAFIQTY